MPQSTGVVLSKHQVRRLDHEVWEQLGLPTLVLMENAAAALQNALPKAGSVVIVCGPGNNGGDGFALARRLAVLGRRARVVMPRPPSPGTDAHVQHRLAELVGVAMHPGVPRGLPVVIVDALFGTGLTRRAGGPERSLIRWMNRCRAGGAWVLAADIPSGIDAESGEPVEGGDAVHADMTVTFAAMKPGLLTKAGKRFAGRVIVDGLGLPPAFTRSMLKF